MNQAVVIIPNYNGRKFLHGVLESLRRQTFRDFRTILVDNGSSDGSAKYVRMRYPETEVIELDHNTGFCGAVNAGIRASEEPCVILLNNDTVCGRRFVEELVGAMDRNPDAFSAGAMMRQMGNHDLIDDSGDYYCALGWAFTDGKGKDRRLHGRQKEIFAACAGAAAYRRSLLGKTGLFDEKQFAYLEDIDLGWRAKILGYRNLYIPRAQVLHFGSGFSGSRYNSFKVRLSARNSLYIIRKNMPALQILVNLPLLITGFSIKALYFGLTGYLSDYAAGLREGLKYCREAGDAVIRPQPQNLGNYLKIQAELWLNTVRRILM